MWSVASSLPLPPGPKRGRGLNDTLLDVVVQKSNMLPVTDLCLVPCVFICSVGSPPSSPLPGHVQSLTGSSCLLLAFSLASPGWHHSRGFLWSLFLWPFLHSCSWLISSRFSDRHLGPLCLQHEHAPYVSLEKGTAVTFPRLPAFIKGVILPSRVSEQGCPLGWPSLSLGALKQSHPVLLLSLL